MLKTEKIVLHSYRRCPFAIRVRMTLEEKDLPYEVIEENLSNPSETLRRLHPDCLVPLLIHYRPDQSPIVLYESAIITEYIEETFPLPFTLLPKSPLFRAQCRLWTHWISAAFKTDLDAFKYDQKSLTSEESKSLVDRLSIHLQKLESVLANQDWILDHPKISLADIHLFPLIRQFTRVTPAFPGLSHYPATLNWLDRILNRPSFERVMKKSTNLVTP